MKQPNKALSVTCTIALALAAYLSLGHSLPASASTISKVSHNSDDRLVSFLQKRFLVPVPSRIKLSPPGTSPFPGLEMRSLIVTNDHLQDTSFTLLSAPRSNLVIIGQELALDHSITDPGQRLLAALQQKFHIPEGTRLSLNPAVAAPLHGLMQHGLVIMGQQARLQIYSNAAATQAIAGEVINLNSDPWDRADLSTIHLTDRPTLGPADAPVTIVEFGDFECPYCAHAINTVENCVTNTYNGRVRLIFKNYPLRQHAWAQAAAIAGNCIYQQNPSAFWDYVHDIYRDQASISPENLSGHVDDFVQNHQLDSQVLHACIMSNAAENRVAQDVADGQRVNVTSTPTFYVNGVPVVGDRGPDTFDFVIDSMLGAKTASAH
jgi:protein-disulfide isomerase